jgi:3'(2'), 5'-bisphosphate nucleotidase
MVTFSLPLPAPAALALCARVAALCEAAGDAILAIYQGEVVAQWKGDGTPLTAADQASHELLVASLPLLPGHYPVVSEESSELDQAAVDRTPEAPPYWLVDPLDGTKEFLSRNGEFTVNVALIWRGQPVLGVVHVPATGDTYAGVVGVGATWVGTPQAGLARAARALGVRPVPVAGLTVVGSRSHGDAAALETFLGAARLAARSTDPVSVLRERVTSKGGTTYAALSAMEGADLKRHFVAAIRAAQARATELGHEFGAPPGI